MSSQYPRMSYNGFSNVPNTQPNSAPSSSENSSGCSSPPSCLRPGDHHTLPSSENAHQPAGFADDEDIAEDDVLDGCLQSNLTDLKAPSHFHPYSRNEPNHSGNPGSKSKASTAERRATHNAIERARRESLNGRFLELARALPTMHNVKRPSKSVIVNKSLEWICESQIREYELMRENVFLRSQLNELRIRLQMEPLPSTGLLAPPTYQVPYELTRLPAPAVTGLECNRNFGPNVSYSLPSQQPIASHNSPCYAPKHRTVAAPILPEGKLSPSNQQAINLPPAGPFSVPLSQCSHSYQPSTLYDSVEGSDRPLEEAPGPTSSQSFGSNPNDDKIPSVYFPGLSIHADSGSPFPTLSEPEGPGSSPPRLRYFSSSSNSDASDKSPARGDYSNKGSHREHESNPLLRASVDPLNSSGVSVEMMTRSLAPSNTLSAPEIPLPIEPFEAHALPGHCHSSNSLQFPPSSYSDTMTTSQNVFVTSQTPITHGPPSDFVNASTLDSSVVPISPSVNQVGSCEMSNGFPLWYPVGVGIK